jgi:hypothetical protein
MKRYVCKTKDEIKYLWDYLKINDLPHTSSLDGIIEELKYNNNVVLFVDKHYFDCCGGICEGCEICQDYKFSEKVNINNIIREEKLKRILE